MKKIISILLVGMMCVSLCACGGSETSNSDVNNNKPSNTTEQKDDSVDGPIQIHASIVSIDEVYTKIESSFKAYSFTQHLKNSWLKENFENLNLQAGDKVLITVNCDSYQDIGWGIKDESLILSIEKVVE